MLYIITYDIEDDRQRNKVSHILEGFGARVQKSVFECALDKSTFKRLTNALEKVFIRGEGNSIRIYVLCADCQRLAKRLGNDNDTEERGCYIYL